MTPNVLEKLHCPTHILPMRVPDELLPTQETHLTSTIPRFPFSLATCNAVVPLSPVSLMLTPVMSSCDTCVMSPCCEGRDAWTAKSKRATVSPIRKRKAVLGCGIVCPLYPCAVTPIRFGVHSSEPRLGQKKACKGLSETGSSCDAAIGPGRVLLFDSVVVRFSKYTAPIPRRGNATRDVPM